MKYTKVQKVFLANNRLASDAISQIIENINPEIEEVNFSNNKLVEYKENKEEKLKRLQRKLGIDTEDRKKNVINLKHHRAATKEREASGGSRLDEKGASQGPLATEADSAADDDFKAFVTESRSVFILAARIADPTYNLKALYLNKCSLRDDSARALLDAVIASTSQRITKLYLNENALTNKTGFKIA